MSYRYARVHLTIEVPAYIAEALGTLQVQVQTHAVGQTPAEQAARALVFHWGSLLSGIQAREIDGPTAERILRGLNVAGLNVVADLPSITAPTTGA